MCLLHFEKQWMEKDIAVIGKNLFQAKSSSLYVNEPIQKYQHEKV
jgi:hypothetical protein